MVTYPPAQLGLPLHVELSELVGWSPWLASVFTLDLLKLSLVLLALALAWMVYPRGTALTFAQRLRSAGLRVRGGAGLLAASAIAIALAASWQLRERFVVEGGYQTASEEDDQRAAWERELAPLATPFSIEGGTLAIEIDGASASATWTLRGVRAERLLGHLRDGMQVREARVDGIAQPFELRHEHFVLSLPAGAHTVELQVALVTAGWPREGHVAWLDAAGTFARAQDLVPKLGFDGDLMLRSEPERRARGLPERAPVVAGAPAAHGVAPRGRWHWTARTPAGSLQGATEGELDFALVGSPSARRTREGALTAVHGSSHVEDARDVLADVRGMRACVAEMLAEVPVEEVVQAPRALGEVALHGRSLWLPEQAGWDVGAAGFGRDERRAHIAQAIASRWLADEADLRAEPGARWLIDGVAGWIGLECVRRTEGTRAWIAQLDDRSDRVVERLGMLDAQVRGLAEDRAAAWVGSYAPLSVLGWANARPVSEVRTIVAEVVAAVRAGTPIGSALAAQLGSGVAAELLGVPLASDVRVASRAGSPEILGERAVWERGGWQPLATRFDVVRHDGAQARIVRVPAAVEQGQGFTVFDAWPSFERSPRDNVWQLED